MYRWYLSIKVPCHDLLSSVSSHLSASILITPLIRPSVGSLSSGVASILTVDIRVSGRTTHQPK